MSFFISDAFAQAADGAQPNILEALFPFVILFVVFYFLLIRPQSKRAKEHKKLVQELSKGDEVVTQGGVLGKIVEVDENFLVLEVADNVQIKLQRQSVASLMPKGTIKSI
ncbi:preprotein translocase subunit YajC [Thiohalomonas denitrificans]|uniref:preprotein translocase subunit YajC n=1 Tax=Thiohalomonas denitrificans TaxID=415747 RepID=UPI0026EC74D9|nr:preprotein translocase subunit YajC [Thiohalomonas denitrificans]